MSLRLVPVSVDWKQIADRFGRPHVKGEFGTAFLNLLRLENRQRTSNENMPERDRYVDGLSTAEVDYLKRTFFGPNQGLEISERMNRLFKSTLELGFPQPGESRSQVI